MDSTFRLDLHPLLQSPRFASMSEGLAEQTEIATRSEFNRFCQQACVLWDQNVVSPPPVGADGEFERLLDRIQEAGESVIRTGWGGVVITRHEHPEVEKYLVIMKRGYLALERHELKDERLEVREGEGLLLSRGGPGEPLTVQALAPGDRYHFHPGMEHCLIGTENLLIFEQSTDPKGMDQDLIFIFEPDASAA
jgi:hypothetical protein